MSLSWLQRLWIRTHQRLLQGLALVLPFPRSKLLVGAGSSQRLAAELQRRGWRRPLLVTDRTLMQLGLPRPLQGALAAAGVPCTVFDRVPENPCLTSVEAGLQHFRREGCDSLIAVGGGSVIDCAKGIAARAGNPWLSLQRMEGLFRVLLPPRPLACVPTTAGSGSEASIAAVFTDPPPMAIRLSQPWLWKCCRPVSTLVRQGFSGTRSKRTQGIPAAASASSRG